MGQFWVRFNSNRLDKKMSASFVQEKNSLPSCKNMVKVGLISEKVYDIINARRTNVSLK